jgi:ribosomal protein L40E
MLKPQNSPLGYTLGKYSPLGVLSRKGLEGRMATAGGHTVTAQCTGTEPPQSPVSGTKCRKCAQILKKLRNVKLLVRIRILLTTEAQ